MPETIQAPPALSLFKKKTCTDDMHYWSYTDSPKPCTNLWFRQIFEEWRTCENFDLLLAANYDFLNLVASSSKCLSYHVVSTLRSCDSRVVPFQLIAFLLQEEVSVYKACKKIRNKHYRRPSFLVNDTFLKFESLYAIGKTERSKHKRGSSKPFTYFTFAAFFLSLITGVEASAVRRGPNYLVVTGLFAIISSVVKWVYENYDLLEAFFDRMTAKQKKMKRRYSDDGIIYDAESASFTQAEVLCEPESAVVDILEEVLSGNVYNSILTVAMNDIPNHVKSYGPWLNMFKDCVLEVAHIGNAFEICGSKTCSNRAKSIAYTSLVATISNWANHFGIFEYVKQFIFKTITLGEVDDYTGELPKWFLSLSEAWDSSKQSFSLLRFKEITGICALASIFASSKFMNISFTKENAITMLEECKQFVKEERLSIADMVDTIFQYMRTSIMFAITGRFDVLRITGTAEERKFYEHEDAINDIRMGLHFKKKIRLANLADDIRCNISRLRNKSLCTTSSFDKGYFQRLEKGEVSNEQYVRQKIRESGLRIEPIVITLMGTSNVGKTTLVKNLDKWAHHILGISDIHSPAKAEDGSKYDDTISNETTSITLDDPGALSCSNQEALSTPSAKLIKYVNTSVTYAHKADLSEKGAVLINPRFVYITTNTSDLYICRDMTDVNAGIRRLGLIIVCTPVPEYFENGNLKQSRMHELKGLIFGPHCLYQVKRLKKGIISNTVDSTLFPSSTTFYDYKEMTHIVHKYILAKDAAYTESYDNSLMNLKYCSDCGIPTPVCTCGKLHAPTSMESDDEDFNRTALDIPNVSDAKKLFYKTLWKSKHDSVTDAEVFERIYEFYTNRVGVYLHRNALNYNYLNLFARFRNFWITITDVFYCLLLRSLLTERVIELLFDELFCLAITTIVTLCSLVFSLFGVDYRIVFSTFTCPIVSLIYLRKAAVEARVRDPARMLSAFITTQNVLSLFFSSSLLVLAWKLFSSNKCKQLVKKTFTVAENMSVSEKLEASTATEEKSWEKFIRLESVVPGTKEQMTTSPQIGESILLKQQLEVRVTCYNKDMSQRTFRTHSFMYSSSLMAMPKHCLSGGDAYTVDVLRWKGCILDDGERQKFPQVVIRDHNVYRSPDKDLCFIPCTFSGFKMLHRFLPSKLDQMKSFQAHLVRNFSDDYVVEPVTVSQETVSYCYGNSDYQYDAYSYNVSRPTDKGDCGLVLATYKPFIILGVHSSGTHGDCDIGHAVPVYYEDFVGASKFYFPTQTPSLEYVGIKNEFGDKQIVIDYDSAPHRKNPIHYLEEPPHLLGVFPTNATPRSTVIINPYAEKLLNFFPCGTVRYSTPLMQTNRIMRRTMCFTTAETIGPPDELVRAAGADWLLRTTSFLAKEKERSDSGIVSIRPLTLDEVLNGLPELGIKGIPMSSSAGFGYGCKKNDCVELVGDRYVMLPEHESDYYKVLACYENNVSPGFVFEACLKNEPKEIVNGEVKDTRIFYSSQFIFHCVAYAYMAMDIYFMNKYRKACGVALGVEARTEWTDCVGYQYTKEDGNNDCYLWGLDFKKFDMTVEQKVATMANNISLELTKPFFSPINQSIKHAILRDIRHPNLKYREVLVRGLCGFPSGIPITAHQQSINGQLVVALSFFNRVKGAYTIDSNDNVRINIPFRDVLDLTSLGDDQTGRRKISKVDLISWTPEMCQEDCKSYGYLTTHATNKNASLSLLSPHEAVFLKRKTYWCPDRCRLMPYLGADTYSKMLTTVVPPVRKGGCWLESVLRSTHEGFRYEIRMWPKKYYEYWTDVAYIADFFAGVSLHQSSYITWDEYIASEEKEGVRKYDRKDFPFAPDFEDNFELPDVKFLILDTMRENPFMQWKTLPVYLQHKYFGGSAPFDALCDSISVLSKVTVAEVAEEQISDTVVVTQGLTAMQVEENTEMASAPTSDFLSPKPVEGTSKANLLDRVFDLGYYEFPLTQDTEYVFDPYLRILNDPYCKRMFENVFAWRGDLHLTFNLSKAPNTSGALTVCFFPMETRTSMTKYLPRSLIGHSIRCMQSISTIVDLDVDSHAQMDVPFIWANPMFVNNHAYNSGELGVVSMRTIAEIRTSSVFEVDPVVVRVTGVFKKLIFSGSTTAQMGFPNEKLSGSLKTMANMSHEAARLLYGTPGQLPSELVAKTLGAASGIASALGHTHPRKTDFTSVLYPGTINSMTNYNNDTNSRLLAADQFAETSLYPGMCGLQSDDMMIIENLNRKKTLIGINVWKYKDAVGKAVCTHDVTPAQTIVSDKDIYFTPQGFVSSLFENWTGGNICFHIQVIAAQGIGGSLRFNLDPMCRIINNITVHKSVVMNLRAEREMTIRVGYNSAYSKLRTFADYRTPSNHFFSLGTLSVTVETPLTTMGTVEPIVTLLTWFWVEDVRYDTRTRHIQDMVEPIRYDSTGIFGGQIQDFKRFRPFKPYVKVNFQNNVADGYPGTIPIVKPPEPPKVPAPTGPTGTSVLGDSINDAIHVVTPILYDHTQDLLNLLGVNRGVTNTYPSVTPVNDGTTSPPVFGSYSTNQSTAINWWYQSATCFSCKNNASTKPNEEKSIIMNGGLLPISINFNKPNTFVVRFNALSINGVIQFAVAGNSTLFTFDLLDSKDVLLAANCSSYFIGETPKNIITFNSAVLNGVVPMTLKLAMKGSGGSLWGGINVRGPVGIKSRPICHNYGTLSYCPDVIPLVDIVYDYDGSVGKAFSITTQTITIPEADYKATMCNLPVSFMCEGVTNVTYDGMTTTYTNQSPQWYSCIPKGGPITITSGSESRLIALHTFQFTTAQAEYEIPDNGISSDLVGRIMTGEHVASLRTLISTPANVFQDTIPKNVPYVTEQYFDAGNITSDLLTMLLMAHIGVSGSMVVTIEVVSGETIYVSRLESIHTSNVSTHDIIRPHAMNLFQFELPYRSRETFHVPRACLHQVKTYRYGPVPESGWEGNLNETLQPLGMILLCRGDSVIRTYRHAGESFNLTGFLGFPVMREKKNGVPAPYV